VPRDGRPVRRDWRPVIEQTIWYQRKSHRAQSCPGLVFPV